jgi:tetratricopeptide (TPR) repeat protein
MASKKQTQAVTNKKSSKITESKYFFEIIVFFFAFALYANGISNGYNLDDELVTRQHRLTSKGISAIPEIFTSNYYHDEQGYRYEYRPIVLTTFAIEHELFGDNPQVSHFFNVLLYAIMCTLLWLVLRLLMKSYPPLLVLFIVVLYIAHPTHTEVVDSIKNRDEILALGFGIGALYAGVRWIISAKWWHLLSVVLCLSLALLSKSSVSAFCITIPLFVLFFMPVSARQYSILALVSVIPILVLSPFFSVMIQVAFTLACLILYAGAYMLKEVDLLNIRARLSHFIRNSPRSRSTADEVKPQQSEVKESVTNGSEERSEWRLSDLKRPGFYISVIAGILAVMAVPVLLVKVSIYALFVPFLVLMGGYLVANPFYKKVLFPFLIISAVVATYFLKDLEHILGVIIAFVLILQIVFYEAKKRYWAIFLLVALVLILFPFDIVYVPILLLIYLPVFKPKLKMVGQAALIVSILAFVFAFKGVFLEGWYEPNLALGLPMVWLAYYLQKKQVSVTKITIGLLLSLPLLSLVVAYDLGHNTSLVVKKLQSGVGYKAKAGEVLDKYDVAHLLNQTQIAFLSVGQQSGELVNSGIRQTKNQMAKVRNGAAVLGYKVSAQAPVSATYGVIAGSKRPVTYIEQPITTKDPATVRFATGISLMGRYVKLCLVPYPLCFYYGFSEVRPMKLSEAETLFSLIIILFLIVTSVVLYRRGDVLGFCGVIFLVSMIPFCSFIVPIAGTFADRFLFFPSLALSIAMIRLVFYSQLNKQEVQDIQWRDVSTTQRAVLVGLILVYSGMTIARTRDWKDHLTLYKSDIKHLSNSAQAHNLLALRLMTNSVESKDPIQQKEMQKEAAAHFIRSIEIYPYFFNTNYDLARTYMALNNQDSALVWFKKATTIDSTFTDAFLSVAELYFQQSKFDEAMPYYITTIRQNKTDYESYERLNYIYVKGAKYDRSIELNKAAIANKIGAEYPYINISRAYLATNQKDSAQIWAAKAVQMNPGNADATQLQQSLK